MEILKNFYPDQYTNTNRHKINHNYLSEQFLDYEDIFEQIADVVRLGDYTLGSAVDAFESNFAAKVGVKHAIGVGSGTDALFLSLKALGIGNHPDDEVLVPSFTFYATIGAIVTAGAQPVFCEITDDFNIDIKLLEQSVTDRTKAIMPVHWSGKPCDMDILVEFANKHGLHIVEDACHAITARYKGVSAGSFGITGCFSLHPLKNLNVWGDGGLICTNSDELAMDLRLLRNHGLSGRDTCEKFAYNSRLDTIQAVVGNHLLCKIDDITNARIRNAQLFDELLSDVPQIFVPPRDKQHIKQVYHIYSVQAKERDRLDDYLQANGVDSKVHYPVPMHLQPAAKEYGYAVGSLPVTERISAATISLPVHEFITENDVHIVSSLIHDFYGA